MKVEKLFYPFSGVRLATLERWLGEAAEHDDRFATALLETTGLCSLRFLLRDEPERVGQQLVEAMAGWPREPFSFLHFGELLAGQFAAMYGGGAGAWQLLADERTRHQRAFLLKMGLGKVVLSVRRAQAALSAYVATGAGPLALKYLDAARLESRALRRSKVLYARWYSPLVEAQLAALAGQTERALALTRTAAGEVAGREYGLLAAPLSYLEGLLEGGDRGREKRVQALTLATAQGWQNPRRFVAMDCPVIDYLEAKSR